MSSDSNSAGPAFADLGLAQPLLRAVSEAGYVHPTPIQAQAIPLLLAGGDLLAAAQTGTGKTAGFTLPILHRLLEKQAPRRPRRPRCLILAPTRELAAQVLESVEGYGKYVPLKATVMFGGVGLNPQVRALAAGVDILVATPGRLLDHCGQNTVDLSAVEIFVLDEADRMLDMGFIRDIRRILGLLPKQRQNMLFSATFSDEIRTLADGLLNNPGYVEVARRNAASDLVDQTVHLVAQEHKRDLLTHLIRRHDWRQVLVFTRTKHGANRLAEKLAEDGIPAAAIHGNKSQSARTRALADFKDGTVPVLVATDIAARGLDIDQLPHVVNFELPNVPEDYVHRIGRTGRAGNAGSAVSLVAKEELKLLGSIERLIKRPIRRGTVEGFNPPSRPRIECRDDRSRRPQEVRDGGGRQSSPGQPKARAGLGPRSAARHAQKPQQRQAGNRLRSQGGKRG
ncbi:DEAD/DEAH box helicase [Methylococcus capsulatus]|uniref:DEAD/DEAH box helicase n=1 Tax=Methylococcus capsulatus TaxID=414 RepID=UPI001C52CF9F|nr:DEAD/DEAH box helicase [Methylococcus capsulatus]QXP90394.1 DEAD/DEAH box helicase [Methylococcus capsulatus]